MRLTEELPMGSYRAKTIYLEPNRNEQECIYKLGQLEDIEEKYGVKSIDDLDKRLMALEAIKALIDIKIDLRDEPQQSVVTLGEQSWFIGDRKIAKLLKEVLL